MKTCAAIAAGIVCLAFHTVKAQNTLPSLELRGYLKNMQSFYFDELADSTLSSGLVHNRLNFAVRFDSSLSARVELRTRIFYEEQVYLPGFADAAATDNGYFDMTALWIDEQQVVAVTAIDRVLLQYARGRWMATAGRQRINWGMLTVWNPNDLFNAYNYLDFDYEERPGTDALRLQYQPGAASVAEGVYAPGRGDDGDIAAFLYRFNRWQYDIQVLGGSYYGRAVAGLGWAGNLGDAGFKGEATWIGAKAGEDENVAASIMADYAIGGTWYVSAATLYILDPSPLTGSTFQVLGDNTTITRLMPFPWSFFAGVARSFTPRLSANASIIYSPEQRYTVFFPSVQYNVLPDLDLDFFAQCFFATLEESYENTGNAVFMRLRWSF